MTILLLGGSGLLGHNVLHHLLQQGYAVHALLRNFSALHAGGFPHAGRLTLFQGSLLDDTALHDAAAGCDAIVNCAGITDMSLLHYDDYLPVNSLLCSRLEHLMESQGITRLVHTSTANTIGYGAPDHCADERSPMRQPFISSYYAGSKAEGERHLLVAAARHPQWHIVIVNPGFMIGAFDAKPSSGRLLLAAYRLPIMFVPRGGKSFIHVSDAATAIVNAIDHGVNGSRYLLTGANLTLLQLYRLQAEVCGYRQCLVPLPDGLLLAAGRLGDLLRCCGLRTQLSSRNTRQLIVREYYDNSRAIAELHMPQTPIAQAVADFHAWCQKQQSHG